MNRSFVYDVLCAMAAMILIAVLFLALAVPAVRAANPTAEPDGQLRAEHQGRSIQFPLLKTDVTADVNGDIVNGDIVNGDIVNGDIVNGDIVNVTIVQTFMNPTRHPLNATYLFPLNKDAAVHAMQMQIGDELISAKIKKRDQARKTFETAKRDGKSAALLEQQRPNMFTQNVANLMPGQPVRITLKYVQSVPRIDGAYELVLPLVVGPRYVPQSQSNQIARAAPQPQQQPNLDDAGEQPLHQPKSASGQIAPNGVWQFGPPPAYPEVAGLSVPKLVDRDRVSITVNLRSDLPISTVVSPSHAVTIEGNETGKTVKLDKGENRRQSRLRPGLSHCRPHR